MQTDSHIAKVPLGPPVTCVEFKCNECRFRHRCNESSLTGGEIYNKVEEQRERGMQNCPCGSLAESRISYRLCNSFVSDRHLSLFLTIHSVDGVVRGFLGLSLG